MVQPGQALSVIPQSDLVITNAALGTELADSNGRTSVKLTYMRPVKITDDEEDEEEKDDDDDDGQDAQVETVLCSFTPGKVFLCVPQARLFTMLSFSKIEQCTLNLTFEEDDEFLLEVVGKKYAPLHLSAIGHSLSVCPVKFTSLATILVGRTLLWVPHQV